MSDGLTNLSASEPRPIINPSYSHADVIEAAGIWARATARRDGLPEVAPAQDKVAGIESALAKDGSVMLVARDAGALAAFAILLSHHDVLELLYLAVDPPAWGQGFAGKLLERVRQHAASAKTSLELWVIADNHRAITSYERAGWTQTEDVKVRNSSGRPERRYTLSH